MKNDTEMTKVVINACYGGFSLSDDAVREYLRRTGQEWREQASEFASLGPNFYVGGKLWNERDLPRTDPVLVSVVEDMGGAANGRHATLEVHELPKGTHYLIDEYDGYESIQVRDDIQWGVA